MRISKKIAALAIAGAMVVGVLGAAQTAQAAQIAGTITITPTSGNVNTDVNFFNSMAVSVGATAPYNLLSGTFVYQGGVEVGSVAQARSSSQVSTSGTNGLDGQPAFMDRSITPTNTFLSSKLLNDPTLSTLVSGPFELRYYYFASKTSPNRATDPYVKLDMTYNTTTGAWGLPAAPAITTNVSLTAGASGTTVSLGATVQKLSDSSTATAAAGSVVFNEGSTTVATVAVASGVASASLTGVSYGTHSYTAQFVPSDAVYATSTSATSTVQVGGSSSPSTVTTTIPSGVGTLTLTGVSSTVSLGTATLSAGTLNASGSLAAVVTDSRQLDYPSWSLTGQVGDFTVGAKTLLGKYLGWTPAVSGSAGGSVAGALVLPAVAVGDLGLKAISQLASGSPSSAGTVTNAAAVLQLKAPSNTPAGAYSATLTLTLI